MNVYAKWSQIASVAVMSATVMGTHAGLCQSDLPPAKEQARLAAQKAAAADPLLNAMQEELDREQSLLLLPGMQRPYFVEYRVDDFQTYDATANYGALTSESHQHQRIVRVTVRIGDYALDSSSARGDGSLELAPEDNDPAAMRYALWTATDEAYKNALRAYASKQAQLKRFEKPQTEKDFSPAPAEISLEPLRVLSLDEPEWRRRVIEASGLYLSEPSLKSVANVVQFSTANVRGLVINRYMVNSEGTVLRHGSGGYAASYSVSGQAADGMRLGRENGSTAVEASGLESSAAFRQRTIDDVKSYAELRVAPVVDADDYHGPVLFSGDAASDVLSHLFVPNVQADRPEMGTTARTNGAYQSSFHTKVLAEMLDAVDNPLETSFKGDGLLGAYKVDDEGVHAQPVDLVNHGKLVNYLVSRTPIRDFPASNGHGRAAPAQAAHAAAGVVIFRAVTPTPAAQMRRKLLSLAKEQGRDVYEVETMAGELVPRLLYRVHPDGSRQLVRGAVFDELDNRSLRSEIVAAGDDEFVFNSLGAIPVTVIAPSLLFGDIEVKRATEEQQKLPYYAPPTDVAQAGQSGVK